MLGAAAPYGDGFPDNRAGARTRDTGHLQLPAGRHPRCLPGIRPIRIEPHEPIGPGCALGTSTPIDGRRMHPDLRHRHRWWPFNDLAGMRDMPESLHPLCFPQSRSVIFLRFCVSLSKHHCHQANLRPQASGGERARDSPWPRIPEPPSVHDVNTHLVCTYTQSVDDLCQIDKAPWAESRVPARRLSWCGLPHT